MQKITPFLWFNDQAEEAANFYISIFSGSNGKSSTIVSVSRYDETSAKVSGRPAGSVMTVAFQLSGQDFIALNGGPVYHFTEAVSLMVSCKTQEELDDLWGKLTRGGKEGQCGWLIDKFGLSWQIVTAELGGLLGGSNPEKSKKVMEALLLMKKIDLNELKKAYG